MKVKELIKRLGDHDPELEVILVKDSEGNGYSPLAGIGTSYYIAETTWSGSEVAEEDIDEYPEAQEVLMLDPTN